MYFNTVEARLHSINGRLTEIGDSARNLAGFQGTWRYQWLETLGGVGLAFGFNGRRGDWRRPVRLERRVRNPANMP